VGSLSNDEEGRLVYLAKSFFKIVKKNEGVMMGEDFRQESMVKRTLFTNSFIKFLSVHTLASLTLV